MQQNTGSGGFGSSGTPGPNAFGAFGRPQQPSSASTTSAPPNTFFRPPPKAGTLSAFSSSFANIQPQPSPQQQHHHHHHQQQQQQQQQSSFGAPRPFGGSVSQPQSQQSTFGTPRPFNGVQQTRPRQSSFNAPRPFVGDSQSQSQPQQRSSTIGSRPRPFTARPAGPGAPQEGRPPNSGSFRGGRGGGTIRPIKPFALHANANQQTPGSDPAIGSGPSSQHASRPRPRPFANKSTTFNNQPQQSAPAASAEAPMNGPNATSAFGLPPTSQSAASSTSSSLNQPDSSFPSTQSRSGFGTSTSVFGSIPASSNTPPITSAFGGLSKSGTSSTFGSSSQSSAFGSTAGQSASPSAFGAGQSSSPFGGHSFSSPQSQTQTSAAHPTPSSAIPPSGVVPNPAPPAAPTSSFSNFLRKDRGGASTTGNIATTPFTSVTANVSSTENEDELRKKRFEDAPKVGNRFLELKGGREALRNAYIKSGVLPDPDKPTDLALAVKLVGTCQDMCPEFEREEREFQKELDPLEVYPGTDRVDPRIAVKIYRRPAAGRELPLPEDVRPPPVLRRTLDYLFHDLLPADPNDPRFTQVQGFLWNRTRAVRQDFIVQSEGGPIAIECHERIARYHILCLHWRGGPGAEGWSEQQELEQLRKTMRSLIEFYDDNRRKFVANKPGSGPQQASPNEAEFRAYNLLLHLRDPETLREAELLPADIFRSPMVQTAINLRQLAQRSNNLEKRGQPRNTEATLNLFSKFFAELRKPNVNYLMACLAENSFSSVRIGAVKAMSKAYMAQHRGVPMERLQHVLGMDSAEQVVKMATHLGLELEYEANVAVGVKIHRSITINEDKPLSNPFSTTIVEAKRGSHTSADVVDGRASGVSAVLPGTQAGSLGSTTAAPLTLSSERPAQYDSIPSFRGQSSQQASSAFGSAISFSSEQSQSQQDVNQSFALGATPSAKLSAAAPSFKPTSFDSTHPDRASTPSASITASGLTGFGDNNATKDGKTATLPSFGGFGTRLTQPSQELAATPTLFGAKTATSNTPSSDTQSKPATPPSFSFGQPPSKSLTTASPASGPAKAAVSAAPSLSLANAAKSDTGTSKRAMPSFFGSSLSQQSTVEKIAEAASRPADVQQGGSLSTPGNQNQRISDAKEDTAAQAASAAKIEAAKKEQAKRRQAVKASAVDRAFKKLSDDVIRSVAEKSAARAVHEEETRRRAASRNELLAQITDRLWKRLANEHAAEAAEKASRIATADTLRSRNCALRAWSRWMEVLDERRDREQQRRRLEDLRSEIRRRNILGRVQPDASASVLSTPDLKAASKTSSLEDISPVRHNFSIRQALLTGERTRMRLSAPRYKRKLEDESISMGEGHTSRQNDAALSETWTRVRRQRNRLWAEGSLLERLADHIEELLLHFRPADLDRFVVVYSGAPGQHVASSWLRVKFGFSHVAPSGDKESEGGRGVLEIDLADGSQLDLIDATPRSVGVEVELEAILPDRDEHSQPGLVIFETSPGVAQVEAPLEKSKLLAEDRKRLEAIANSKLVKKSQLACRLLVVSWGSTELGSEGSLASKSLTQVDGDVEMSDLHPTSQKSHASRQVNLLSMLGLDPAKTIRNGAQGDPHSATASQTKPSSVLSRAFERVGVLELDDASISVEKSLVSVLAQAMPDLTPNPVLYVDASRRSTLEDVVLPLYDQWARTCALLLDVLCGLPRTLLSSRSRERPAKVEHVACKTLQVLTALANHIIRTTLDLSDTILEDGNASEQARIELPLPLPSTAHDGDLGKLVGMALCQLDQLAEEEEQVKLLLRSRLLSNLEHAPDLQQELMAVNRLHVDQLFRHCLDKLHQVWLGARRDTEHQCEEAREVFARLCGAAVDEVAGQVRAVWSEYRVHARMEEVEEERLAPSRGEEAVSPSTKRVRVHEKSSVQPSTRNDESVVHGSTSNVSELRDLIARTRQFLDNVVP